MPDMDERNPEDTRSAERHDAAQVQLIDEGPQDTEGRLVAEAVDPPAEPSEGSIPLDVMGSDGVGTAAEETALRIEDVPPGGTNAASDGYVVEEGRER